MEKEKVVVLRKSYWFWIILILQVCFILKMVHDTYLNDMWATHYTINPHSDLIANVDYMLKDNKFSGTALVVKDHQVLLHKGYGRVMIEVLTVSTRYITLHRLKKV